MPLEHPCAYRECPIEQGILLGIMVLIILFIIWYIERWFNRRKAEE